MRPGAKPNPKPNPMARGEGPIQGKAPRRGESLEPTPTRLRPTDAETAAPTEGGEASPTPTPPVVTELVNTVAQQAGIPDLADEKFNYARRGETAEQYALTMLARWSNRSLDDLAQKAEEYTFAFQQGLREHKMGIIPTDVLAQGIVGQTMNLLAERRHLLNRKGEIETEAGSTPLTVDQRHELTAITTQLEAMRDLEVAMQQQLAADEAEYAAKTAAPTQEG